MNTTHSIVGELLSADLQIQNDLPTLTLHLRQRSDRYSRQHIIAVRSYPGTLAGGRLARDHHAGLRIGSMYRVAGSGIGVGQQTGVVYLLGVTDASEAARWHHPYPAPDAAEPNSLAAEGACAGLAMSMPRHLQAVAP